MSFYLYLYWIILHNKNKKVVDMIKKYVMTHADKFKNSIPIYHLISILGFISFNAFRDEINLGSVLLLLIGEIIVLKLMTILSSN